MKANPDKFQALTVGESTFEKKPIFRIGEAQIEFETTVKILGVEIDYLLKFDLKYTLKVITYHPIFWQLIRIIKAKHPRILVLYKWVNTCQNSSE